MIGQLTITAVEKRPLNSITQEEVDAEGFVGHTPETFIQECVHKYNCQPHTPFRFITFTYET